jgi:hypothetical protein
MIHHHPLRLRHPPLRHHHLPIKESVSESIMANTKIGNPHLSPLQATKTRADIGVTNMVVAIFHRHPPPPLHLPVMKASTGTGFETTSTSALSLPLPHRRVMANESGDAIQSTESSTGVPPVRRRHHPSIVTELNVFFLTSVIRDLALRPLLAQAILHRPLVPHLQVMNASSKKINTDTKRTIQRGHMSSTNTTAQGNLNVMVS